MARTIGLPSSQPAPPPDGYWRVSLLMSAELVAQIGAYNRAKGGLTDDEAIRQLVRAGLEAAQHDDF